MGGRLVDTNAPEVASFNVTVSAAGTVSSISIANPGIGYTVSPLDVKFNAPPSIGVGIGTTATATATVSNGRINSVTLTNPGLGYTLGAPNTIIEVPMGTVEEFASFQNIQGFTGIITGINATTGTNGNAKALKINFRALDPRTVAGEKDLGDATDLQPGYPILIHQTTVGTGVTSIDANDASVVGIGTQFLDNVYIVASRLTSVIKVRLLLMFIAIVILLELLQQEVLILMMMLEHFLLDTSLGEDFITSETD